MESPSSNVGFSKSKEKDGGIDLVLVCSRFLLSGVGDGGRKGWIFRSVRVQFGKENDMPTNLKCIIKVIKHLELSKFLSKI